MEKRILFVVGSGMGNQAETISAFALAKKVYGDRLMVVNSFPYAFDMTKVLFGGLTDTIIKAEDVNKDECDAQICTYLVHDFPVKGVPHIVKLFPDRTHSEVEHNMKVTGIPYTDDDFFSFGGAMEDIPARPDTPDILIHNGYNKVKVGNPDKWKAKSYELWPEVIKRLKAKGLRVGTIGTADEHIEGCENLTGTEFRDSVSAMKGCRLLLSNDTGTFHVANVIGTPNVAVFTFTDRKKNFEPRFHRLSTMVASKLPCSPCQFTGKHHWLTNRSNCGWACRRVDPDRVIAAVEDILK